MRVMLVAADPEDSWCCIKPVTSQLVVDADDHSHNLAVIGVHVIRDSYGVTEAIAISVEPVETVRGEPLLVFHRP